MLKHEINYFETRVKRDSNPDKMFFIVNMFTIVLLKSLKVMVGWVV